MPLRKVYRSQGHNKKAGSVSSNRTFEDSVTAAQAQSQSTKRRRRSLAVDNDSDNDIDDCCMGDEWDTQTRLSVVRFSLQ